MRLYEALIHTQQEVFSIPPVERSRHEKLSNDLLWIGTAAKHAVAI